MEVLCVGIGNPQGPSLAQQGSHPCGIHNKGGKVRIGCWGPGLLGETASLCSDSPDLK